INGGATELLINQRSSTQGTALFIKDLFFNTPARLKFVKSKVSEKSALKKMIYSFVLSNPHVTFTIKWDEKEKEIFKSTVDSKERVAQVFFAKKSDTHNILVAEETYDNYTVKIFFTKETYTTPQYRHHYLFANKRFFQDKSLHAAVLRNLDIFWRFGESGHYMVEIVTPLEEVDVNVHPNKTQIKFLRSDVVYSLLVTSIKKAIKSLAPTELPNFEQSQSSSNNHMSPQSFFSRDENQSYDLMNFSNSSNNSDTDMNEGYSLFNRESAITNVAKFQRLHNRFIIAELDKTYLIDLKKLLTLYLTNELKIFSLSDESTGPLLISEPFKILKGKIDQEFEALKLLGFEFDRLNAEYIVLRTIPKFLPQSLLSDFTETLIRYYNLPKTQEFESSSFQKYFEEHFPISLLSDIPESLIERIAPHYKNSESMVELTENRLSSLFK
ncbi:MAG: hypothetical protein K2Q18_11965, partial [Bdellovibrionales bacterium]|nr:hypothetical protein [Bdellovibrionales bacterium]